MKRLKFKDHLIDEIKAGTKTCTWRLFDDKDLQVGDKIELLDESDKVCFTVEITSIREKPLDAIQETDYEGHETYSSHKEMIETYKKYYGAAVTPETIVKMIDFKVLETI